MPRELKSRPSTSPTHPGIQVISARLVLVDMIRSRMRFRDLRSVVLYTA
jgi:hypothetical protein